jgi:hypothetical protein
VNRRSGDEDKPSSHTRVRHENAAAPSQSPLSAAIQSKLIDSLLTRALWIAAFGSSKVGRIGMTSYTSTDVISVLGYRHPKQLYERWTLSPGHVSDTGIFVVARDADVMASRTVCNRLSFESRRLLSTLYSSQPH